MSSLAAARADNFYYPPDFDGKKHGSLNKYNGQHPLRDRARKLDQGILVIRFEVPFNIWCDKCGEHIGKGVRFNAEKQQVGTYYSTKIWAFSMRHHCGSKIVIQTDPKITEYVVTEGAHRKAESYEAEQAETIEIPDAEELERVNADPLSRLERTTEHAQRAAAGRAELAALVAEGKERHKEDYKLNKALRAQLRSAKKEAAALDSRRDALGLPQEIKLLPDTAEDAQAAQLALFASKDSKFKANWQAQRRKIMTEGIFAAPRQGASASGGHAGSGRQVSGAGAGSSGRGSVLGLSGVPGVSKPPRSGGGKHARFANAAMAVAVGGGATAAQQRAKEQQLAALTAASRKRSLLSKAAQQQAQQRRPVLISQPAKPV